MKPTRRFGPPDRTHNELVLDKGRSSRVMIGNEPICCDRAAVYEELYERVDGVIMSRCPVVTHSRPKVDDTGATETHFLQVSQV